MAIQRYVVCGVGVRWIRLAGSFFFCRLRVLKHLHTLHHDTRVCVLCCVVLCRVVFLVYSRKVSSHKEVAQWVCPCHYGPLVDVTHLSQ